VFGDNCTCANKGKSPDVVAANYCGVRAYAGRIRGRLAVAVFGIPIAGLIGYVLVTNGV
jgi:hypothetical protein